MISKIPKEPLTEKHAIKRLYKSSKPCFLIIKLKMNIPRYAEMMVSDLGIKSRSKKEVYDLLSNEGDVYLPPQKDAHHEYLSQLLVGDKQYLKCSQVKVCRVPHYKGLRVEDLLEFAQTKTNIQEFLPDYEYDKKPNREFLCNVINTLITEDFRAFIDDRIKDRVKYVVNKKSLTVKALPEFIKVFSESKNVSVHKGRSHFLLQRAGRKKWDGATSSMQEKFTKQKRATKRLETTIGEMQNEIDQLRLINEENKKDVSILGKLYDQKVIDAEGNLL